MKKLLVPALAVIVVVAVGFVLVELHAPLTPSSATPPSPALPVAAPPPLAPARPPPAAPPVAAPPIHAPPGTPPVTVAPAAPAADPLDVVVRGKTRREWHAYYAERQRLMTADIQRYQAIVDRAIAGEEPDPRELGNAHDSIRELNQHMKEDLEALQQIDATP
jgi:hypothetical protein